MIGWLGVRSVLLISVSVVLLVLVILVLSPIRGREPTGTRSPVAVDSVPESFVSAKLSISQAPTLGQVATLSGYIVANTQSPNLSARIDLPPGLEALGTEPVWSGALERGKSASFRVPVRAVAVGEWVIELRIGTPMQGDISVEDIDRLYLTIGQDDSTISETQPAPPVAQEATQVDGSPAQPVIEDATLPEPYDP